jgi:casein kinase II subunit beta
MQWLRLRPESGGLDPGELDLVDWRGRWIDKDDKYDDDDEEEEEEEEDLLMEDFDPVGCPCYYSLCEGP